MSAKPIRLGFIGVTGRGGIWKYIHKPEEGATVVAGADVSEKALKDFRDQLGPDTFITTDYHELIQRDDIDGILVATPDRFHAEHAVAALNAGKYVYCEKPMHVTVEGCDAMLDASRRQGDKLMIGFNMRYMPFVLKMKQMLDDGVIGDLKAVWERHFVGRGNLYYFHDWHANRDNTSSLLLQKGSHDIDVVHFLAGSYTKRAAAIGGLDCFGGDHENTLECDDCPEKDTCMESDAHVADWLRKPGHRFCAHRKEINVPDDYLCLFQLENGVKFSYNECHFTPDYNRNFTFIGTKGRIENSEVEQTIKLWTRKSDRSDQPDEIIDVNSLTNNDIDTGHGGADPLICQAFVRMCRGEISSPVPPLAGRMAVAAGLAAQWSIDHGFQAVDIKPYVPKP